MRNVYLINLSFGLAGIERRFANVWQALRRRGNVRPILVVPDTLAEVLFAAGLAERGDESLWVVPEHSLPRTLGRVQKPIPAAMVAAHIRSRFAARSYRSVWERITADPAAIIHVGLNCSALTPSDAPIVYEAVDSNLTQLASLHYVKAAARRSVINCQTDRIRLALEQAMVSRRPQWTTVTSPCCFASYSTSQSSARDSRLIAFVGRFSPEKNPLMFVDAIGMLRAQNVLCRALMLGEGPMESRIRERIDRLGLGSIVEMGFSKAPAERLSEAAVYVSLQTGDNYPSQSLLEAMGAGCAVVATNVGETARLVRDDVGLLISQHAADLTAALSTLVRDPERTARMGAAASRLVRTEHTADRYAGFLESLYELAAERYGSSSRSATVEPLMAGSP